VRQPINRFGGAERLAVLHEDFLAVEFAVTPPPYARSFNPLHLVVSFTP